MARLDPLVGGPHDEVHKSARPGPTVKRLFIHELNFIIGAFNEIEQRSAMAEACQGDSGFSLSHTCHRHRVGHTSHHPGPLCTDSFDRSTNASFRRAHRYPSFVSQPHLAYELNDAGVSISALHGFRRPPRRGYHDTAGIRPDLSPPSSHWHRYQTGHPNSCSSYTNHSAVPHLGLLPCLSHRLDTGCHHQLCRMHRVRLCAYTDSDSNDYKLRNLGLSPELPSRVDYWNHNSGRVYRVRMRTNSNSFTHYWAREACVLDWLVGEIVLSRLE